MQADLGRPVTPAEVSQAELIVTGAVLIASFARMFQQLFEEAQRAADE